jgi:hypothetical protein
MATDQMAYNAMVQSALRGVVRTALERAVSDGLPGEHHFYIGFRTNDPGVEVPDHLRASHPDEMTIVLQHQYWGLEVDEDGFYITLSFNHRQERLRVPFAAMTSFYDPSVQFGLQFQGPEDGEIAAAGNREAAATDSDAATETEAAAARSETDAASKPGANIVTLETFRKK